MTEPTLILHRHEISSRALSCDRCKKPLDWHKSFGMWCAKVFGKGRWQDYLADGVITKELEDDCI